VEFWPIAAPGNGSDLRVIAIEVGEKIAELGREIICALRGGDPS
jgi:hypothetical protein